MKEHTFETPIVFTSPDGFFREGMAWRVTVSGIARWNNHGRTITCAICRIHGTFPDGREYYRESCLSDLSGRMKVADWVLSRLRPEDSPEWYRLNDNKAYGPLGRGFNVTT
jgi:hypothetical protein